MTAPDTTLPLDSAPIPIEPDARLTAADLRRIEPVQQVLLRPLDYPTVDAWREAVNQEVVAAVGGDTAMFQLEVPGAVTHYSADLPQEPLVAYAAEFMPDLARTKQIYRRALRLGAGNRFTLWKDHLEWLYGSDYFNEVVVKLRAFDTLWASAPAGEPGYPAMLHAYHARRHGGRRFGPVEVQMMRVIRPALQAGVQTVRRVFSVRCSLGRAIDRLDAAVFAFSPAGRLIHRNPRASLLARSAGGDEICSAAAELARGFAHGDPLRDPGSVRRRVVTASGTYELDASHLAPGTLHLSATVLVTIASAADRLPTEPEIRERFGLTRRQAEVALLLAQRLCNREIADRLFISPHTALRHTEAVMMKLATHDRRLIADRLRERSDDRP